MRRTMLIAVLLLFVAGQSAQAQTVTCPDAKPIANQYRGLVKHRMLGTQTGAVIHVSTVYTFPDVTVATAASFKTNPMPGSKETKTFTLDAFLWQAKVEGNDCEIHLELSDSQTSSTARRMIVEIPPNTSSDSDYKKMLSLIQDTFHVTDLGPDKPFRFTTPVHLKITGFGFFDGVHKGFVSPSKPNGNHGTAAVKTFWELHPAWNVRVITP